MTPEKDLLLALLDLTHAGRVRKELVSREARVPASVTSRALQRMSQENLFQEHEGLIDVTSIQRVEIAVRAAQLGADFERVCRSLSWSEFESVAAQTFVANNYGVAKNFRFKQASRRWEIDILGFKRPVIICVDCKHWKHDWGRSAIAKAVKSQVERTKALADASLKYYEKAGVEQWKTVTLVPVVLSLARGPNKFYDNVPIVPVFQLQGFINELPSEICLLKYFRRKLHKLNEFLTGFRQ